MAMAAAEGCHVCRVACGKAVIALAKSDNLLVGREDITKGLYSHQEDKAKHLEAQVGFQECLQRLEAVWLWGQDGV